MEEKKKSNMPLIIIIVILLLAVVGLGGYIVYDKVVLKNDKIDTNEKKTIDKDEDDDVEETLSESEKTELSTKTSQILFRGILRGINGADAYVTSDDEQFISYGLDSKILTDANVTLETKALVALNSVVGTRVTMERTEKSEEEVKNAYKSYFGTDWKDIDLNNLGVSCPYFSYDSGKKVFYADAACGGSSANKTVLHKDDYEIENGVATVDLYVASLVVDPNGKLVLTSEINPNYERLDSSKIITEVSQSDENYVMSETDREKSSKYELSFKKADDGSFYFNSITKK